ncbi:hypothetical protein Q8A67_008096 [Cirrhinus molitorella]|uniref:Uncharacterized protein n=1 Tax=Cirrhinus molitorella TaxID=172907 RepID=A0AA88TQF4_9TELE|nr:hypothetical protein Q8A67_008096 [Cirrhinus molitorella]
MNHTLTLTGDEDSQTELDSSLRHRGSTLRISSFEEVDTEMAEEAVQYEELLEVVARAVDKLKLDWPTETPSETPKNKLDESLTE